MRHLITLPFLIIGLCLPMHGQEDYKDKNLKETYKNDAPYKVESINYEAIKFAKKPRSIILLIGDGMGVSHVFAGYTANGGVLNLSNMPYSGFSATQSSDNYVTDSGAGGTALSTGVRTYNGAIGVDDDKNPIPTILEIAQKHGKATGLISSSAITHATPASFIAHQPKRSMYEEIAADFLKTDIDLFIGGGKSFFAERKDGRNLIKELEEKGYRVFDNMEEAAGVNAGRLVVLAADQHCPPYPERGELLPEATGKAVDLLNKNPKGFFMMVEGSQIDWGGHENNTAFVVQEMLDFDRAIGKALEFAARDKETLVIVTADHETGGMSITGGSFEKNEVTGKYTTGGHSAVFVPVFSFGPGAEHFSGIMDNTDIFHKMHDLFGF